MSRAQGVAWREAEELAKAEHHNYKATGLWEEPLSLWVDTAAEGFATPAEAGFTAREAMVEGLGFSDKEIKKAHIDDCAKALRSLGFTRKKERRGKDTPWIWRKRS